MDPKKGKIFIISGPSGVGKGLVINIAKSKLKNFYQIKTITTRSKRSDKKLEQTRIFVSHNQFKQMIKKGEIIEYNFYNNEYYGTPKKELEKLINSGRNVLLEVDINGAKRIKQKYPQEAILVFIWTSLKNIENRLRKRKQNTDVEIQERLRNARKELQIKKDYRHTIENKEGKPKQAAMKLVEICNSYLENNSEIE